MFSNPDPLVSYRNVYPEVPAPEVPNSPALLSLKWVAHDLYGEQMPGIAPDLLEQGYDTPSLRRLAGEMMVSNSADVEPLVERMFQELGIKFPISERKAQVLHSIQIAREVIAGMKDPWKAAHQIEQTFWRCSSGIPEIDTISSISDEVDWEAAYRRSTPELKQALLEAFASLASIETLQE